MKEVQVLSWCDYPDCADEARNTTRTGQETTNVILWLYTPGRGRKPNQIKVELCEEHLAEMKALMAALAVNDQGVDSDG